MQLLLQRAVLVNPGLGLVESNAEALAQICRRLDGIPLALELAAARMASFAPDDLAVRLDDRLDLLAASERGRPSRHQTMRAALEWSYHLLEPAEKVLFRRLGIFTGGFGRSAMDAVCVSPQQRPAAAGIVSRLVDKSMVLVEPADRDQFRLLETMREYARELARAAGETRGLARRHAEFFLTLIGERGRHLRSLGAPKHLAELERNLDNIRAALEWASANDHLMLGRMAVGLHSYWSSRCSFREALVWVNLALSDSDLELRLRQPLLASAGWLEIAFGQLDKGLEHSQEALQVAEAIGDARGEVRALINLSEAIASRGDYSAAVECATRARVVAEGLQTRQSASGNFQDQALLAGAWGVIGDFHITMGEPEKARGPLELAINLAHEAGDCFSEALGRCWLSEVAIAEGSMSRAAELARRALELGIATDHRFVMLRALGQLAAVAAAEGMAAQALRLAAAVGSFRGTTGAQGFDQVGFWFGQGWSGRLEGLREEVGPAQAELIWHEGARLTVYEAASIALAGEVLEPTPISAG